MGQRTLTTDEVRAFVANRNGSVAEVDLHNAVGELLIRCNELDETPEDYGFEFVVDDANVGDEGVRETYYAYNYPHFIADGYTAKPYILAPDDNHPDDATVTHYRGVIFADDGNEIADSDEGENYFDTVGECVAWINEQIGGEVITKRN